MVDFNHQLVDQCSQKRSNTRSHYGHPPPATSGPAKIDSMFALRQLTMWGNKMGISRASGVKPLTWKHPPPNRQCRWTTEVQNLLPGWVHIRCLSPLRCQWPALLLPLRQAEDNEGWSCSCGPREPGRTAAERPCRSPGCHGSRDMQEGTVWFYLMEKQRFLAGSRQVTPFINVEPSFRK